MCQHFFGETMTLLPRNIKPRYLLKVKSVQKALIIVFIIYDIQFTGAGNAPLGIVLHLIVVAKSYVLPIFVQLVFKRIDGVSFHDVFREFVPCLQCSEIKRVMLYSSQSVFCCKITYKRQSMASKWLYSFTGKRRETIHVV